MESLIFLIMAVFPIISDGFTVHGPSAPLSAPLGSSVVLPCSVDEALPVEDLEVEWTKTDTETLVHLFQDGESRAEVHDRAHFFTEEIQHGNFSLRLDNLRDEDEGEYRCKVYSQLEHAETVVNIKDVERLLVSGSNRPAVAYVGEDVTLNCSVDSHITPEHIEEVSWRKIDGDEDILILIYQNNETSADVGDEHFRGRVEFFTAEIPKGNFSLRLKSVRTEDKGVYMCQGFAGGASANATVQLEQLGFSFLHIAVLFFCFAAGSGDVLLLSFLIHCRLKNTVSSSTIWSLQLSLILFPNLCMFLAFILWGFTEGSLYETITCSSLYILRPFMLIWVLPYLKYLQDKLKRWIEFFTATRELCFFTLIVYSVFFMHGWRIREHHTDLKPLTMSGMFYGLLVLISVVLSTVFGCKFLDSHFLISMMSAFQLPQLFFLFGYTSLGTGIFVVLAVIHTFWPFVLRLPAVFDRFCRTWIVALWIIAISVLEIILAIYIHILMLEREKERMGWICVISFIEVLKIITILVEAKEHPGDQRQQRHQGSDTFFLCNEIMYMFGAVGVVLLSSVSLTAELILKARTGERVIGDLRVIVFPFECVFAYYWLLLQIHSFWKVLRKGSTHSQRNCPRSFQHESTTEDHEMETLPTRL